MAFKMKGWSGFPKKSEKISGLTEEEGENIQAKDLGLTDEQFKNLSQQELNKYKKKKKNYYQALTGKGWKRKSTDGADDSIK